MTTVSDYLGMVLTGRTRPMISADMAASWGGFDLQRRAFQAERLSALGVDPALLPKVCSGYALLGEMPGGVPVCVSPGDNQAAMLGSVRAMDGAVLINVGTGSQISMGISRYLPSQGSVETRPCGQGGYLLAGSGLCGGRAYALLEAFYREASGSDAPCYDRMLRQAEAFVARHGMDAAWRVRTTFSGTRDDPAARGEISGIGIDNFSPGALTAGLVAGILEELREAGERMRALTGQSPTFLAGSGNGLRRNPLMRRLAGDMFGMKLHIPVHREEAAYGAALCALNACGEYPDLQSAQRLIRYEE